MAFCNPFMPTSCTGLIVGGGQAIGAVPEKVGNSMVEGLVSGLAGSVSGAIEWLTGLLAAWMLVPSNSMCPTKGNDSATWGASWVEQCNNTAGPAQQLRGFLLPLTVLLLVAGLTWQGITIAITRKGEPLMQAVRGVWNTALWGAIGIAGTHLMLRAGDSYSMWILEQTIFSDSKQPPNAAMTASLQVVMIPAAGVAPFAMLVSSFIVLIAGLAQLLFMVFREGAVVILAGILQLAAAGTVTRGTSQAMQKTAGWCLALGAYKPAAASVYATAHLMMRGNARDWLVGMAMFALSIVALPALVKFFTIFTGGSNSSGGALGMLGAGAAAGMHAASSLRGAAGGNSAGDHARYMDTRGPGTGNGGGNSGGNAPTGAVPTPASSGPGPNPGPMVNGQFSPSPAPAAGAAASTAPAAGAASSGAAAGGAAAGGAAATGPAAPVVMGAVVVGQAGVGAAKSAANTAGSAMGEGASK